MAVYDIGAYDGFRFKPAPWLPHSDLLLEELERVRNIKREDMEYTNKNGCSVKVVINPAFHEGDLAAQDGELVMQEERRRA